MSYKINIEDIYYVGIDFTPTLTAITGQELKGNIWHTAFKLLTSTALIRGCSATHNSILDGIVSIQGGQLCSPLASRKRQHVRIPKSSVIMRTHPSPKNISGKIYGSLDIIQKLKYAVSFFSFHQFPKKVSILIYFYIITAKMAIVNIFISCGRHVIVVSNGANNLIN